MDQTETVSGDGAPEGERRQHKRQAARVSRLIRAVMGEDAAERNLYLYLVDVSAGGLRVNLDFPFEEERAVRLRFVLEQREFDGVLRPTWQKCLAGGTWTVGLELVDPGETTTKQIDDLMAAFSPQGRRERFKLRQLLAVTIRRSDDPAWFGVTTLDISSGGLRVRFGQPLAEGEEMDIKVFPDDIEVEGRARVAWTREVAAGRWESGLQFLDLPEVGTAVIQRYIDQCVGAA